MKKVENKKNYFSEKEMISLVSLYKENKNNKIFAKIEPVINKLINGMINRQFSYNYHIINNRKDVISECYYEILISIERYDPERGRLYAYLNRIIKNTLMKYYVKSRKIKDKESNYTDLSRNIADDNDLDLDQFIISMGINNTDEIINSEYDTNENIFIKPNPKNVTLKIDTTVNIMYNYINDIKEIVKFYLDNEYAIDYIINDIHFNNNIEFSLFDENEQIFLTKKEFYYNIIENYHSFLNNIINFLKCNYKEYISKEPENYDGYWSNRAIGYIRKFVNVKLKNDNLAKKYDVTELVSFINYLIKTRYKM